MRGDRARQVADDALLHAMDAKLWYMPASGSIQPPLVPIPADRLAREQAYLDATSVHNKEDEGNE